MKKIPYFSFSADNFSNYSSNLPGFTPSYGTQQQPQPQQNQQQLQNQHQLQNQQQLQQQQQQLQHQRHQNLGQTFHQSYATFPGNGNQEFVDQNVLNQYYQNIQNQDQNPLLAQRFLQNQGPIPTQQPLQEQQQCLPHQQLQEPKQQQQPQSEHFDQRAYIMEKFMDMSCSPPITPESPISPGLPGDHCSSTSSTYDAGAGAQQYPPPPYGAELTPTEMPTPGNVFNFSSENQDLGYSGAASHGHTLRTAENEPLATMEDSQCDFEQSEDDLVSPSETTPQPGLLHSDISSLVQPKEAKTAIAKRSPKGKVRIKLEIVSILGLYVSHGPLIFMSLKWNHYRAQESGAAINDYSLISFGKSKWAQLVHTKNSKYVLARKVVCPVSGPFIFIVGRIHIEIDCPSIRTL